MEFAGPAPIGPFASLAAELPWRKTNDVKQVQPGDQAGDTAADTRQSRDQQEAAAAARDITAMREEARRRELPAGPSPAFQVSLLEIKQDIKDVIARVEAARTQTREADALKAEASAEERAGKAEVAALEAAAAHVSAQAETPSVGETDPSVPAASPSIAVDPQPGVSDPVT